MARCRAYSWSVVKVVHVYLYSKRAWTPETLNNIIWPSDGAPVGVTGTLHLQEVDLSDGVFALGFLSTVHHLFTSVQLLLCLLTIADNS